MPDLRKFNQFMNQYVPYIVKRKAESDRIRQYLEKSLQEYAAYGNVQRSLQESGMNKEVILLLLNLLAKGVEDSDRPGLQLLNRIKEMGMGEAYPGLRLPTPETGYEEAIVPYQELGKGVLSSMGVMEYPEADLIENFIRLRGTKEANEFLDKIAKGQKEKTEIGIREKEHALGEEELAVRKGELAARKKEVEMEGEGGTKKSTLRTKLDSKRKERWGVIEKLAKYEDEPELIESKSQAKALKSQLESLNSDIKKMKKDLGEDPDEEYAKLAKTLKGKGFKKKDLFENKELRAWFSQNNYNAWMLLEYF